ncbi:hypothetical protein J6590_052054 [Homalodisca vitripennis]|nr:hypothetical protein J6590_052054 [Homalodisca vitripennis]
MTMEVRSLRRTQCCSILTKTLVERTMVVLYTDVVPLLAEPQLLMPVTRATPRCNIECGTRTSAISPLPSPPPSPGFFWYQSSMTACPASRICRSKTWSSHSRNRNYQYSVVFGVPMAERSKMLDFESELEIAQVRILSVILALFISTIDLVLYRLSPLFCLIRSSHRPVFSPSDSLNAALTRFRFYVFVLITLRQPQPFLNLFRPAFRYKGELYETYQTRTFEKY